MPVVVRYPGAPDATFVTVIVAFITMPRAETVSVEKPAAMPLT